MLITITRTNKTVDGIFGTLTADASPFKCVTAENRTLAILAGIYDILFMWSNNFQQIMPHIIVANRSAIEIHWANWPGTQLEGCLALGTEEELSEDMIEQSKIAWISFVQQVLTDQPAVKIRFVEDYA
jgi:hypothetical protein